MGCDIIFLQLQLTRCDVCQHMNRKLTTGTPQLNPIPVKSPWHMIGIDFVGPINYFQQLLMVAVTYSQFVITSQSG